MGCCCSATKAERQPLLHSQSQVVPAVGLPIANLESEEKTLSKAIRDEGVKSLLLELSTLAHDVVMLYIIRNFPSDAPSGNEHPFSINAGLLRLYAQVHVPKMGVLVEKSGEFLAAARHYMRYACADHPHHPQAQITRCATFQTMRLISNLCRYSEAVYYGLHDRRSGIALNDVVRIHLQPVA